MSFMDPSVAAPSNNAVNNKSLPVFSAFTDTGDFPLAPAICTDLGTIFDMLHRSAYQDRIDYN
jgi:hypothetical protein